MKLAARTKAAALGARLIEAGAVPVDPAILQPAETLLDLYGEDIRARAYVTSDPGRGEMMLRPDFTVPVVQMHMARGASPARYTYAGEVFRRQEDHPERESEFLQVGFELFDGRDPAAADAEVFSVLSALLQGYRLRAVTGDIGILMAVVQGIEISDQRRAALMRHLWRPRRFRALLDRFSGKTPVPPSRAALLAQADPMAEIGTVTGLRTRSEIAARVAALQADAAEGPMEQAQLALIDAVLGVRESCEFALQHLRDIAVDLPSLGAAVDRFEARLQALAARGVDVASLEFEASFGRTSMEYYDGFVFGLLSQDRPDLPPLATGGRYDALTQRLGQGRQVPAVGGIVRPDLLLALESGS